MQLPRPSMSRGVIPPTERIVLSPLQLALHHIMTFKPFDPVKHFALPALINITKTARYHKQFTPTQNLLRQTSSGGLSPGQTNSPRLHQHTIEQLSNFHPPSYICPLHPPWKAFFGKNSPQIFWGGVRGRNHETYQFLLNFLITCDNN